MSQLNIDTSSTTTTAANNTATINTAAQPRETPHSRYRRAYEASRSALQTVLEPDWVIINIDVPTVISTIQGVLPQLLPLRPQIALLPGFNLENLDSLEQYNLALGHAHTQYQASLLPPATIQQLGEQGVALRQQLISDVEALSFRGLIDKQRLGDLKGGSGYLNLAFDLFLICTVLRENQAQIAGKTALTPAELDAAETIADQLINGVGLRDQGPAFVAAAAADRQRAFTLLLKTYEQVRRAVVYLRWDERDADELAPSLYSGRVLKRKAGNAAVGTDIAPAATPPTNAAPAPAPAQSGTSNASPAVGVGLPGALPFSRS